MERKTRGNDVTDVEKASMIREWQAKSLDILEIVDNELKASIPEPSSESKLEGAYGLYEPVKGRSQSNHIKNSDMEVVI